MKSKKEFTPVRIDVILFDKIDVICASGEVGAPWSWNDVTDDEWGIKND